MVGSGGAGASRASRVEIFSEQADALIVWPGGEIGPAHLTVLTDPISQMTLAFSLTKDAPKVKDLNDLLLRHCDSSGSLARKRRKLF